ncbi:MAG: endonuclease/exonuclease/phosphatase family protein [Acidobacteriota bacterium]|nr:MAG: endonuclease/exonuclease/phosphatase family protein [Acidobacteriota bacterium]
MSFFYDSSVIDARTAAGLLRLRNHLDREVPARTISDTLMLATWNIREFDSSKGGPRTPESIHYIAEILSRFDLIAVQEVNADLEALKWVQSVLGDWWKFIVTDVTGGRKGNQERMAFLFDSRKVKFGGLAGEIVVPPEKGKDQLARTPFVCGFETGWLRFMLCTVHIYWGTGVAEDPKRAEEIDYMADFLADHVKDKSAWAKNLVLLGDFNIFNTTDQKTFGALTKKGRFFVPRQIQQLPSNIERNKHYDQMAFISAFFDPKIMQGRLENCRAGVFNFFESVYRDEDELVYAAQVGQSYQNAGTAKKKTQAYRFWRTFHMSDHLPMWFELPIDFGKEALEKIAASGIDG